MLLIKFLFIYLFSLSRLSCTDSKRREVKKGLFPGIFLNLLFLFYSFIIYLYLIISNLFLITIQSHELIHSYTIESSSIHSFVYFIV